MTLKWITTSKILPNISVSLLSINLIREKIINIFVKSCNPDNKFKNLSMSQLFLMF